MGKEKRAIIDTGAEHDFCTYESLDLLANLPDARRIYFPVGSVEFTQKFCSVVGIRAPTESFSYYYCIKKFLKRKITRTVYSNAQPHDFVKPQRIKVFTGGIKADIDEKVDDNELVWVSPAVPFDVEYRCYIHDFVFEQKILGWSRYDNNNTPDIPPDLNYVREMAKEIHSEVGPNAYTLDIGYRTDIREFDLVEMNDAWSIGYYTWNTPHSKPPTPQDYVDMLRSRWIQILFVN